MKKKLEKFFLLKVRSSIKTKKKLSRIREVNISLYLTLYAKVFVVISTIYSTTFVIQRSFLRNWDKI